MSTVTETYMKTSDAMVTCICFNVITLMDEAGLTLQNLETIVPAHQAEGLSTIWH